MKYLVNLDLDNNQLLNVVLQNLATAPASPDDGQVYYNTSDSKIYARLGGVWVDITETYAHPTFTAQNPSLNGANVLASLETNSEGHVISSTTRVLTLADLGYTGSTSANDYTHPTFTGNTLGGPLSGATVISDVTVNSEGHVTDFVTRNLTASDINAIIIDDTVTNTIKTWSSQKIQNEIDAISTTATGSLIYKGGYDAATNTPNLDSSPTGVMKGHTYTVTNSGNFYTEAVQPGDMIVAEIDNPTGLSDWTVVNKNIADIVDASETDKGIIKIATTSEVINGTNSTEAVTPSTLLAFYEDAESNTKYATDIGDGTATLFSLTHNFDTRDVLVDVYDNTTYETVVTNVVRNTLNNINIEVNKVPTSNQYRVVLKKA